MTLTALVSVLVVLVILGLVLYLVETYVPMSPPIRTIFRVVVVLCLCLWLLSLVGLAPLPLRLR